MPIPDERLPQLDEFDEEAAEPSSIPGMLDEADELEFESSPADDGIDEALDETIADTDTAGFGYGDSAE